MWHARADKTCAASGSAVSTLVQQLCFVTKQVLCCCGPCKQDGCAGCPAFVAAVQQTLLQNTCLRQQEGRLPDAGNCCPPAVPLTFYGAATAPSIGLISTSSRMVGRVVGV